uniref:Uncharacterized protein n=1 Tax=Hyaloperonospora arabidopsidis (strain Emoy2) TaxID=559515 RepID=M4C2A4_HYAAE
MFSTLLSLSSCSRTSLPLLSIAESMVLGNKSRVRWRTSLPGRTVLVNPGTPEPEGFNFLLKSPGIEPHRTT